MWIILPATSGAPHGTADCSKRGRWARGEGTPPLGSLTSIPTDRASLQMADRKVTRPSCKDKCFFESWQAACSLSSTSCLTAAFSRSAHCKMRSQCSLHFIYFGRCFFLHNIHHTCWEQFGVQRLAQGHFKMWTTDPMINGPPTLPPELQLPL